MSKYKNCYFAFLDLLGFKEIVSTKTCDEILEIFDEAKKEYIVGKMPDNSEELMPVIPPEDIQYYIMSDSICIFIESDKKSALPILMWLCLWFQVRLLCLKTPILVRGSIVKGDIYKDKNTLFGPAMVDAYLRTEKLAGVPRVIITEDLYNEMADGFDKLMLETFTYLEQDGFYATNYIQYFCIHNCARDYRKSTLDHLKNIINSSTDRSVREKCLYVKNWMEYYLKKEEHK